MMEIVGAAAVARGADVFGGCWVLSERRAFDRWRITLVIACALAQTYGDVLYQVYLRRPLAWRADEGSCRSALPGRKRKGIPSGGNGHAAS